MKGSVIRLFVGRTIILKKKRLNDTIKAYFPNIANYIFPY